MEDDNSKNRCDLEKGIESITVAPKYPDEAENPVREITQTDHLNKKLLSAFLEKINEKGDNSVETENCSKSSDWESETKQ